MPNYAILLLIQFRFVGTVLQYADKGLLLFRKCQEKIPTLAKKYSRTLSKDMEVKKQTILVSFIRVLFQGFFFFFSRGGIGGLSTCSDFGFVSFTCDANQWERTRITFWNRPRQNPLPPPNGMAYLGNAQLLGHYAHS